MVRKKRNVFILAIAFLLCFSCCFIINHSYANASDEYVIEVDLEGYTLVDLPNGVEGRTYPVFSNQVVNATGEKVGVADVLVFNDQGNLIPIVNGRFSTLTSGQYSIEYTFSSGTDKIVEILSVDVMEQNEYVEMNYVFSDKIISNAYTGTKISLYEGTITGGLGKIDAEFSVKYFGNYVDDYFVNDAGNSVDYFIPNVEGVYEISYALKDVVGCEKIVSKEIEVVDSDKPIMDKVANIPVAYVGETVNFNYSQAKLYIDGKIINVPVQVFVNDIDVTTTMSFKPETSGNYVVKYVAKNIFDNSQYEEYSYSLEVKDVLDDTAMLIDGYLSLDGFSSEFRKVDDDDLDEKFQNHIYVLTADGTNPEASMKYKNAIHQDYLNFSIGAEVQYTNYNKITLTLCDSVYYGQKIEIELSANRNGKTDIAINGVYATTISKSLVDFDSKFANTKFNFTVDVSQGTLKDDGTTIAYIEKDARGINFNGFDSGYAYFSLTMSNITEESRIKIISIAGQVVSDAPKDRSKPFVIFSKNRSSSARLDIGDSILLEKPEVYDVYDTNCTIEFTLSAPDGTIIKKGLMTEDYTLNITQLGKYNVLYTAKDTSGNTTNVKGIIVGIDRDAPVLEDVEIIAKSKVGKTIKLPEVVAVDEHDQSCSTWIAVITGPFQNYYLTELEYTFTKAGVYTFVYGAQDSSGNMVQKEYIVTVS